MAYGPIIIPVVGGVLPYTFEIINGQLPPNLSINTVTGVISGDVSASTRPGAWDFTVQVTDSDIPPNVVSKSYTINVIARAHITEDTPIIINIYERFSYQLKAKGGSPPYTYSSSDLPSWVFLTASGLLSGTAPAYGDYSFTVNITDSLSCGSSKVISLTVKNLPEIVPVEPPCIAPGTLFGLQLVAKNGVLPYSWTTPDINFQLPEYLELDPITGYISGIVYDEQEKITHITVEDGNGELAHLEIRFRINRACGTPKYIPSPLSDPVTIRNDFHQMNLYGYLPDIY
jgi:hypothetical protein